MIIFGRNVRGALTCKKPVCNDPDDYLGHPIYYIDALIDSERKILMDWTPKAGSTASVVMFLKLLGAVQGMDYTGWPHDFRTNIAIHKCGTATSCAYNDPAWFRFKVVRNPFARLVSAYVYLMRATGNFPSSTSFTDMVNSLSIRTNQEMEMLMFRHLGYQHRPFERTAALRQPPTQVYHEVVHLETARTDWERVVARTNITVPFFAAESSRKFHHYSSRDHKFQEFIGDQPWERIEKLSHVPSNYGCFYNVSLIHEVAKIFAWDLRLYRYQYPFTPCGEHQGVKAGEWQTLHSEVTAIVMATTSVI